MVHASLVAKIENGVRQITDETFLHTEPHHDDIMLGPSQNVARERSGQTLRREEWPRPTMRHARGCYLVGAHSHVTPPLSLAKATCLPSAGI